VLDVEFPAGKTCHASFKCPAAFTGATSADREIALDGEVQQLLGITADGDLD